jgi:hypothetical protein
MKNLDVEIVPAPYVRRTLTTPGDIRSDVDFQNDINSLLARIEEVRVPWQALSRLVCGGMAVAEVMQPNRNAVTRPLRIVEGAGANHSAADGPIALAAAGLAKPVLQRDGAGEHPPLRRGALG